MSKIPFQPVRTTEDGIKTIAQQEGRVYFTSDSGCIYMDTATDRVRMGSAGISIYYGTATLETGEEITSYTISKDDVQGKAGVSDLIFNADGGFYKILKVEEDSYICSLLAVSGGTSSTPSGPPETRPKITRLETSAKALINGQEAYFSIDATSQKDESGYFIDTQLSIVYRLYVAGEEDTGMPYYEGIIPDLDLKNGMLTKTVEFGSKLRHSTTSTLKVQVIGDSHTHPSYEKKATNIVTSQLTLSQISSFSPTQRYEVGAARLYYQVVGSIDKLVKIYFDDMENPIEERYIPATTATYSGECSVPQAKVTHGTHLVKIELHQVLYTDVETGKYVLGNSVTPLKYEIPVVANDPKAKPVIWLGEYKDVYYTYDNIIIPFLAFDPSSQTEVVVHLCKDKIEIGGGERRISEFSEFSTWEIADAEQDAENNYSIWCGTTDDRKVEREFQIKVIKDPKRDMSIMGSTDMVLNFNATGRNKSETPAQRASWSYELDGNTKFATFENFNWNNNGWDSDPEIKTSFLRISNGAKLTIPFKPLTFGSDVAGAISHTIEMQVKVSNVQRYGTLITNITRYNVPTGEVDSQGEPIYVSDEEEIYPDFLDQTDYTNYDAYLQATLDADTYDGLQFRKVEKMIDMNNIVGGFYAKEGEKSIVGVCLGTEDTFFSNGTDTVNVNFVEDQLLNLSFVYQHGQGKIKNLYIYINGVITGVIKSTKNNFTIDSMNFVFDSQYCDIDLYKLRVFSTDLNVSQIVNNFAVDRRNVDIYDQNALAIENGILQEYQLDFKLIENYNLQNPNNPTMPYIIYHTGGPNSKLSYSKEDVQQIQVEFVNVPLEQAYANGELKRLAIKDGLLAENETNADKINEAVKLYYKHHCPSWTSSIRDTDRVSFEVQGTSSQFYPRRNYKIKTKTDGKYCWKDNADLDPEDQNLEEGGAWTEEDRLNIFMHKGPYAETYNREKQIVNSGEEGRKQLYGNEECRLVDGWYLNNYTNGTDRWTMKVDYMESSGSYNAGFASMVGNAYSKHPLQDYLSLFNEKGKLKPVVDNVPTDDDGMRWEDYRTSLLGFPVMAFQKRGEGDAAVYTFLGYYRMLLDKSSREVLGYKPNKKVTNKLFPESYNDDGSVKEYKRVRDIAECWEFSNNARGYCSYRDPWNRVQLSFLAPEDIEEKSAYTAAEAPIVCNSFEYRYHALDDAIDVFYNYKEKSQIPEDMKEACDAMGVEIPANKLEAAKTLISATHSNWEKFCQWVWSTNLDAVPSQGRYTKVRVGTEEFDNTQHYVIDPAGGYKPATVYSDDETYYIKVIKNITETDPDSGEETTREEITYAVVAAVPKDQIYAKNKFYYLAGGAGTEQTSDDVYALCADDKFSGAIDYYKFTSLDANALNNLADPLIAPASGTFNPAAEYYTFNGAAAINPNGPTGAVVKVPSDKINENDFNAGKYYVKQSVTFNNIEFTHDTKEYRAAKFVNEFTKHLDPEYAAAYFVMTEVMECYDSRGKNCMMASWGPHEEGGDYIWYPVFYDIDTQLGINNTGIPSFTFNVDATEANNFSTSDSILWNNMYKLLKNTYIVPKYKNLRGWDSSFKKLTDKYGESTAPLQSVDYIEKWYTFDPEITNNIACRGVRPLIATNLDMYFKYITITNPKAQELKVGHLNDAGEYAKADTGTYFYALQGDRSQSRQQFVTSRLEYIDSWLTVGNYARGGANRLWGRISANDRSDKINLANAGTHSDKWTEVIGDENTSYWLDKEFGTKRHEFDAEYWLEPKPIRSCYVTAGEDSENYPSKKYDGISEMKFKINELENGIRRSDNYPEQLLYIYGTNQMSDFGDLSKLYWTEFKLEGDAKKLTRLKLGHDGTVVDYASDSAREQGKEKETIRWYNNKLNGITLPELPLLKEANFSNIGLVNETALDFTQSAKLQNFRAAGASNLTSVTFAPGVALNTLYFPTSVNSLKLVKANALTNLIKDAATAIPKTEANGDLTATPGLYLEGFFTGESSINTISLDGGALGYNSYDLLATLYERYKNSGKAYVTMKDVQWCPYTLLTEGDIYDSSAKYYIDNGHYGFTPYVYNTEDDGKKFNADVLSGLLYRDDGFGGRTEDGQFSTSITQIDDTTVAMLQKLNSDTVHFADANSSAIRPQISGIIYINNATALEESEIAVLQQKYPNLTFFFANVIQAYSAKFILYNEDDFSYIYVKHANGSTSPSVQKISAKDYQKNPNVFFTSPYPAVDGEGNKTGYLPEKTHYDFQGWCLLNTQTGIMDKENIISADDWAGLTITAGQYDYTYCAVFTIHNYEVSFWNADGTLVGGDTVKVPYGSNVRLPEEVPYKDDSNLELLQSYNFKGYSQTANGDIIDPTVLKVTADRSFYSQFELIEDIRTVVHPEWFTGVEATYDEADEWNSIDPMPAVHGIYISPKVTLKGKITIPRTLNGLPVIAINGQAFGTNSGIQVSPHKITHVFFENGNKDNRTSVYKIGPNAFRNVTTLKYFDFGGANIRYIGSYAFQLTPLDITLIDLRESPIKQIETFAFNQALTGGNGATLFIPSSTRAISVNAFTNLSLSAGCSLVIGSDDEPSVLDLKASGMTFNAHRLFQQGSPDIITTVTFYSTLYNSPDTDIFSGTGNAVVTVRECFINLEYQDDIIVDVI